MRGRLLIKQGSSTVVGLLSFLLLATFGAAAYFVSRAHVAQNGQAIAVQLAQEQKQKMAELEQIAKRLESEWRIASTKSENAMMQLNQLQGLIKDQNQEIDYLLDNLQSASNQLEAAGAVKSNLNQRLLQLDKEKNDAVKTSAILADQLKALEKEFSSPKVKLSPAVVAPATVAGLPLKEAEARLRELEAIKKHDKTNLGLLNLRDKQPEDVGAASGTVRKVDAKFGFVILDVGAADGVNAGDLFSITRADEQVGQVRVRKMLSGLPVCDIIADRTTRAILQGDLVQQLK